MSLSDSVEPEREADGGLVRSIGTVLVALIIGVLTQSRPSPAIRPRIYVGHECAGAALLEGLGKAVGTKSQSPIALAENC